MQNLYLFFLYIVDCLQLLIDEIEDSRSVIVSQRFFDMISKEKSQIFQNPLKYKILSLNEQFVFDEGDIFCNGDA